MDPLFFVNGFAWTLDTRLDVIKKVPFILYPFQEGAFLKILKAINVKDLLIEKSRDMGATWLCVTAIFWRWLFFDFESFLFVSRVEEYVDEPGNPKALFHKFDFLLDNLPSWLQPLGFRKSEHRRRNHIENPQNGSVVDGESTTENVARGDRRTAILLDEFAVVRNGHNVLKATRDATKCRLFNSTPAGINNAFYDLRQGDIERLRLHWTEHPIKAAGLYTSENGKLIVLDPAGYPAGYKPILDGKVRSPWYDMQCSRAVSAQEIAQELDINYLGSGCQFFNPDRIQTLIKEFACLPVTSGTLEIDKALGEPRTFLPDPQGLLKLWIAVDRDGRPKCENRIVIGTDISAGTGASNSCLCGYDGITREKVLEFASPYIRPEGFAEFAVAVCRWFKQYSKKAPFLIWEANGPGRQFGARTIELGYSNIYFRSNDASIQKKVSDIPGWAPTRESQMVLLGEYRAAVENKRIINRSKVALEETLEYTYQQDGSVDHARAKSKQDPSGARANHGDYVIADALAYRGMGERKILPRASGEPEIPVGCLAWRIKMREAEKVPKHLQLSEGWGR